MKLLILLSRFPYPLHKGDQLRAFQQIKVLAQYHEIHLFCINSQAVSETDINQLKSYCHSIKIFQSHRLAIAWQLICCCFNGNPLQYGFFVFPQAIRQLQAWTKGQSFDHVYCQLIRMAPYAKALNYPATIDFQDAFSLGMKRRIASAPRLFRWIFRAETHRLQRAEQRCATQFRYRTIISEVDREAIHSPQEILIVRNGIDASYFHPLTQERLFDLVFVGNLAYPPNQEAALFLAKKLLPKLTQKRPQCRLLIAGAQAPKSILKLQNTQVEIWNSPADIRCAYASAKLFVAPMFLGSGLQNKLLEAMAMGIPCITTDLANNALQAPNPACIRVANEVETFCDQILDLLEHPDQAKAMADQAQPWALKRFDWEQQLNVWMQHLTPNR